MHATRELILRRSFDMNFLNGIMDLVAKRGYDVEISSSFQLTTEKALHDELRREALADSRAKAESIAQSLGQMVKGIESACIGRCGLPVMIDSGTADAVCSLSMGTVRPHSDQVGSPLTKESESLEVVWLIE